MIRFRGLGFREMAALWSSGPATVWHSLAQPDTAWHSSPELATPATACNIFMVASGHGEPFKLSKVPGHTWQREGRREKGKRERRRETRKRERRREEKKGEKEERSGNGPF